MMIDDEAHDCGLSSWSGRVVVDRLISQEVTPLLVLSIVVVFTSITDRGTVCLFHLTI
jgi:hypothetical protein